MKISFPKCSLVCAVGYVSCLMGLPSGGDTIRGEVQINSCEAKLQIQVAGKAIINWDQFDISPHETVSYFQREPKSPILNRVIGDSSSQILGQLESNCPLFLINPQGVFVGERAQIHTAGFLASTADLSNEGFWQGSEWKFQNLGPGKIVNLGQIKGYEENVYLIARSIENVGSLQAPQGEVNLITNEVMINPNTKQTHFIRVGNQEEGIRNRGTIQALSVQFKTTSPYEEAICHTGTIEAFSTIEKQGRIYLVASNGQTVINGSIAAESGEVHLLGNQVCLKGEALIDVSGETGGTVLVGGDYKGSNPDILNAKVTRVEKGAQIRADAKLEGDGGKVIIWGDESVAFFGSISAEGGKIRGDGGFVEVSTPTPEWFYGGEISTRGHYGKAGTVLFDPSNITIFSAATNPPFVPPIYNPSTASAILNTIDLQNALASSNVVISTSNGVGGQGAVTFNTNLNWSSDHQLQVLADRNITVIGSIANTYAGNVTNNPLIDFRANVSGAASGAFDGIRIAGNVSTVDGDISFNGTSGNGGTNKGVSIELGSPIFVKSTGKGNISIVGKSNGVAVNSEGFRLVNSGIVQVNDGHLYVEGHGGLGIASQGVEINTGGGFRSVGAGDIEILGYGNPLASGNSNGFVLTQAGNCFVESTGTGNIQITGYGGSGSGSVAVWLDPEGSGTPRIRSQSGNITIYGEALSTVGTGSDGVGIYTGNIQTVSGQINITGIGKNTTSRGVILDGGSSVNVSATGSGSIIIQGTGGGGAGNTNNQGIRIASGGKIITNTGALTCVGIGGTGTSSNEGIQVTGAGSMISSSGGAINLTGTGGGTTSIGNGIAVIASGQITNSGSGTITLQGTAAPSAVSNNSGILVSGTSSAVTATSGNITLTAIGNGSGATNAGLTVSSAAAVSTTSGTVNVASAKGSLSGTTGCHGIFIDGINTKIAATSGAIQLNGVGQGTADTNQGIRLSNAAGILSTAGAPITLNGQGSISGTSSNEGIFMTGSSTVVNAFSSPIAMTGTAGKGTLNGIILDSGAVISTTTTGTIQLNSSNALSIQNSSSVLTLGASPSNISITTDGVSLTAGALGSALVSAANGNITINSSNDVVLTGGATANRSAQITTSQGNIQINSATDIKAVGGTNTGAHALIQSISQGSLRFNCRNLIVQGGSASTQSGLLTPSGDIVVNCSQNCTYTAPVASGVAIMRTFGSDLTVVAGGSISLSGFTTYSTPAPIGNIYLVAGQNVSIGNSSQVTVNGVVNSSLNIVVDNNFPFSPGIGPGQFNLAAGGVVTAAGETPVRIWTARRSQNIINNTINSTTFVPGPFDVNTNTEQWSTYFSAGSYLNTSFKIYYKEPILSSVAAPFQQVAFPKNQFFNDIAANLVQLSDLLPVLKMPPLWRDRFPSYHFQICDKERDWKVCDPVFSPYGSFIFEDHLYWISPTKTTY